LKIQRADVEPAPSAVHFCPHDFRQNETDDTEQVHRERTPPDPVVVDQAGDHEGKETDYDPLRLFTPEFRRHRIFAHIGLAVDGYNTENVERKHDDKQQPIEAEQLSKERRHVGLPGSYFEYSQRPRLATSLARPKPLIRGQTS